MDDPSSSQTKPLWVNKTSLSIKSPSSTPQAPIEHNDAKMVSFVTETQAREVINPKQIIEMFERDFNENTDPRQQSLSVNDRRFLSMMSERIHKRSDGHYEMPLPLKTSDACLPNNKSQALRRLAQLKARLRSNDKLKQDYTMFMQKTIDECAEEIPVASNPKEGRINYLPHHGVYHPKKRDKIRVVFDCSAVFQGTSLNKNLLQGPDLTNNLQGVLCRFRKEPVALCCDVEGMFHQFFVDEEDRDLLRFFWWKDGDLDKEPTEYRMKVHVFGAASSPGCANFGFKQAASDGQDEFGQEAANFIKRDFYVDDGLKSAETPETATELIKNAQAMCAKAGLRLHKIASNNKELVNAIAIEDRAKSLQEIDIEHDPLPIERTLGVMWCIEADCFQFKITIQDRPLTRRGILSTVCSVFDPLGFLAPVVLVGKQLLQELCRQAVDWDEPISDSLRPRWERWRNELRSLEDIKIARCYKPENFGRVKLAELHNFSDASQSGYGQCSYLRLINEQDEVHCSLVMAKARVTPLKPVTIPRLELTAAVVSIKVSQWLCNELEYENIQEIYHTDSQVVLGYINNNARRFHIYVANRVQQIHEHSNPKQWQYVSTDENPADAASRGLTAQELVRSEMWFKGPKFLWVPGRYDSGQQTVPEISKDDPEIKIHTLTTEAIECTAISDDTSIFNRFSSWYTAKRAVAYCNRFKNQLKYRLKKESKTPLRGPLSLEELRQAELTILKVLQHEHFGDEIKVLKSLDVKGECVSREAAKQRNTLIKTSSNLYKLDPYIDDDGLLRVGGRLGKSTMHLELKHPVIVPRNSHLTTIIVRHYHEVTKHQGRGMTLNEIQQNGFWIVSASSVVSEVINKCVTCKKLRGPLQQQKMSDLPTDRMEPAPPFTYCAVDYFGPFTIKEGRKELKRYGVLFTCMASRAIHLETAVELSTDSFLNALRRFLAERWPVRQIRSDCGTNVVGAKNELSQAINEDKIRDVLLKDNCEINFKMNPPSASHARGVWERQIRSVRNVLKPLMLEAGSQLDDESFRTLMKECQAIVNSRPLTTTSADELEPLTPNHLLTMKSKVLMPSPGVFQKADLYCRKRWRRVQHLANLFWRKWRQQYLQSLQIRTKWQRPRRNLRGDDIVIIKEDSPRCDWKMARVQEVFPSDDGLVRKVRLAVATSQLDKNGRRMKELSLMERPVQKLVLLKCAEE